jgi:ribosomal protein S18 acetylase RimI-like enzyme
MLDLEFRLTRMSDSLEIERWLSDPAVFNFFPMYIDCEFKEAATRWVSFSRYRSSLTAIHQGKIVGLITLYLQPYKRMMHQSELGIIVAPEYRGQGIGSLLFDEIEKLAKKDFKIELLHLQVYYDNPAVHLYERKGFTEFGRQDRFMKKEDGTYQGRVFMQKYI